MPAHNKLVAFDRPLIGVSVPGQGEYMVETESCVKTTEKFFHDIDKQLGAEAWELVSNSRV